MEELSYIILINHIPKSWSEYHMNACGKQGRSILQQLVFNKLSVIKERRMQLRYKTWEKNERCIVAKHSTLIEENAEQSYVKVRG